MRTQGWQGDQSVGFPVVQMKRLTLSNGRKIKKRGWIQENLGYKTGRTWSWNIRVREQGHSRVTSKFLPRLAGVTGERTSYKDQRQNTKSGPSGTHHGLWVILMCQCVHGS